MSYVPREGSKTEAAVNFIRQQGGWASMTDLGEAADIPYKNMAATFKAAVEHGLLAKERRDGKNGFAIRDPGGLPKNPPSLPTLSNLAKASIRRATSKPGRKAKLRTAFHTPEGRVVVRSHAERTAHFAISEDGSLAISHNDQDIRITPADVAALKTFITSTESIWSHT